MIYHSRPVYIGIAVDVGPQMISAKNLSTPLTTTLEPNDSKLEDQVISEIASALKKFKKSVIIVDGSMLHLCYLLEGFSLTNNSQMPFEIVLKRRPQNSSRLQASRTSLPR